MQNKTQSPLVQSILTLDESFAELNRLSGQIDKLDLRTDADFERAQRLMNLFNEAALGVGSGVVAMSNALNEARAQAERAAEIVAVRAADMQKLQTERQQRMDAYRQLGEKVQALTASLNDLKRPAGEQPSEEDRAKISMRLSELELQLQPLIDEATQLKEEARLAKMSVLEESAHSLSQSLQALTKRLGTLQSPATMQ
jgi:chromosome segregation ATPase